MIEPLISFYAGGVPRPQGSHDPAGPRVRHSSPELASWRETVAIFARQAYLGKGTLDEPVIVAMTFRLRLPKKFDPLVLDLVHVDAARTGPQPAHAPDVDKLARAVLDAIVQSRVLRDDSLVLELYARKRYVSGTEQPGVRVSVWRWADVDATLSELAGVTS